MSHPMASVQAVRDTGLTPRQVDYYARRLRIPSYGSGNPREFTGEQLATLRAIKAELDRHRAAIAALLGPAALEPYAAAYNHRRRVSA